MTLTASDLASSIRSIPDYPKPGIIFSGLPKEVTVGRYHSIFADPATLPADFEVTATSEERLATSSELTSATVSRVSVRTASYQRRERPGSG